MSSKAREALSEILDLIDKWRTDGVMEHWQYSQLFDVADSALAELLKNCEVGTAEEQNLRHGEWCRKHGIDGAMDVPCASPDWHCHLCFARWSQMPSEKGEDK